MPRFAHRLARLAPLAAALALLSPGTARPAEACTTGTPPRVRLVPLRVQVLDASGRPVNGVVEVDGTAAGATNRILHVPICAAQVRVSSGGLVYTQPLALRDGELNQVQGRLGQAPAAAAPTQEPTPAPRRPEPVPARKTRPLDLPAGMVALHYYRPDGQYEGWGLHTWETLDGNRSRPLAGVTWGTPLEPTGEDAFGVYWVLPAKEYRNGQVNFIVHASGDRECIDDQSFPLKKIREAWIKSGVCRVYASADAARAARP